MATRPSNRRAAIVAVAADLFATKGFAATSVDEIAGAVGITGPAIYRHVRGKDALLDAVMREAVATFAVTDDAVAAGLERIVTDAVEGAIERPELVTTYLRERHRLQGDARKELRAGERAAYRRWRGAIQATNPDLDDVETAVRQQAALTAMSAVAVRRPKVARPELDALLIRSTMAVLTAAPRRASPPATTSTSWTPPQSRRDEILAQAVRLFREGGYHGVGVDEIGEVVGVTGPTLYFHYESKLAILIDAYEQAALRVMGGVHEALAGASSASDALDRLAASFLRVAHDSSDLIVVTSREGWALPAEVRPRFARVRREVLGAWVAVLRELRPELDDEATRALVSGAPPLMTLLARDPDPASSAPVVRGWCLGIEQR